MRGSGVRVSPSAPILEHTREHAHCGISELPAKSCTFVIGRSRVQLSPSAPSNFPRIKDRLPNASTFYSELVHGWCKFEIILISANRAKAHCPSEFPAFG